MKTERLNMMKQELRIYSKILQIPIEELRAYSGFCEVYEQIFNISFTQGIAPTLFKCCQQTDNGTSDTFFHWYTPYSWYERIDLLKEAVKILEAAIAIIELRFFKEIDLQNESN